MNLCVYTCFVYLQPFFVTLDFKLFIDSIHILFLLYLLLWLWDCTIKNLQDFIKVFRALIKDIFLNMYVGYLWFDDCTGLSYKYLRGTPHGMAKDSRYSGGDISTSNKGECVEKIGKAREFQGNLSVLEHIPLSTVASFRDQSECNPYFGSFKILLFTCNRLFLGFKNCATALCNRYPILQPLHATPCATHGYFCATTLCNPHATCNP